MSEEVERRREGLTVELKGDMAEMFSYIKEHLGFKTDREALV